jgi:hypothetical protein
MTRSLPPLHEGHAPIFLHQAFDEALDAFEDWAPHRREPDVEFEGEPVPISFVFGHMRECTDMLPMRTLQTLHAVTHEEGFGAGQVTYAEAAALMRTLAVERLQA